MEYDTSFKSFFHLVLCFYIPPQRQKDEQVSIPERWFSTDVSWKTTRSLATVLYKQN